MMTAGWLGSSESNKVLCQMDMNKDTRISPIALNKFLVQKFPEIEIKRLSIGKYLLTIEALNEEELCQIVSINDKSVTIKRHPKLNTSRGTILCPELNDLDDDELEEFKETNNISTIIRRKRKINNKVVLTDIYELIFNIRTLPPKVKLGYLSISTRQTFPDPLLCYKCFNFGHVSKFCKSEIQKCGNCSEEHHDLPCQKAPKCIRCKSNHPAWSRSCEKYKERKELEKIKFQNRCSLNEAKQILFNSNRKSFASAVQKGTNISHTTANKSPELKLIHDLLVNISKRLDKLEEKQNEDKSNPTPSVSNTLHTFDKYLTAKSPANTVEKPSASNYSERRSSTISTCSIDTTDSKSEIPESNWTTVETHFNTYEIIYGIKFQQFKSILENSRGKKDILSILHEHDINSTKKLELFASTLDKITINLRDRICHSFKHRITRTKNKLRLQLSNYRTEN